MIDNRKLEKALVDGQGPQKTKSKGVECRDCNKFMLDPKTTSCDKPFLEINGREYKRNTTYFDVNKRCHDCGILNKKGNVHHLGCDMEICPACKDQLIGCDCEKSNEPY